MATQGRTLLWLVPLAIGASIAGSLAAAWLVSWLLGLHFDAAKVVVLSAALSAAVIAVRLSTQRRE